MLHFTTSLQHTSTAILIAWYQLTYFDAVLSFCKMTVPYPGYRVVEEACMTFEVGGNGG
jgi:hypothetical protein